MNSLLLLRAPVLRLATRTQQQRRLQQQRNFSIKRIFTNIFARQQQPIPVVEKAPTIDPSAMATIQELQQEKQKLEERIHELVEKLESRKPSGEIKVKPEQIIKSKEEQEAAAALEKLEIQEASTKAAAAAKSTPTTTEPKKAEGKAARPKKAPAAKEPEKPIDVSRLDLRIGKILEVSRHPDADALYLEKIDCGDTTGPRTVISGLVKHIPIEEMQDRIVVVLCNLKPAKMRGILSEAMVMCASTAEKVELIQPPVGAKPGDRLVFEKYPGEPDDQLNSKKKIWEQVAPDLKTNESGVAMYKDCPFKIAGLEGEFKSNLTNVNIK